MPIEFVDWGEMASWEDEYGNDRSRDVLWFCGNVNDLESIQNQVFPDAEIHDNDYLFEEGPGQYLYKESWVEPQIGDYGRVEIMGYWDFTLLRFVSFASDVDEEVVKKKEYCRICGGCA